MSVIDKIRAKAAADVKHVVLAEGTEPRTVQAAEKIVKLGLAKITLVGAKAEIEAKAFPSPIRRRARRPLLTPSSFSISARRRA